jgi:hypothetical protein
MTLDASPRANWRTTGIRNWRARLWAHITSERGLLYLTLAGVGAALLGVFVSVVLMFIAIKQTEVMVLTVQYQSAVAIIDQSTQVTEDLLKQPNLEGVLKGTNSERAAIEKVNQSLDNYQTLIFKASLLMDKKLLPPDFWNSVVSDFCGMYNNYPFISSWWARQKDRKPYTDLSARYRDLGYGCRTPNQ